MGIIIHIVAKTTRHVLRTVAGEGPRDTHCAQNGYAVATVPHDKEVDRRTALYFSTIFSASFS